MPLDWQVIAIGFGALVLNILTEFRSRPHAQSEAARNHALRSGKAVTAEEQREVADDLLIDATGFVEGSHV